MDTTIKGQLTADQISELKEQKNIKKLKEVFIPVGDEDDGDKAAFYLRPPSLAVMTKIEEAVVKGDMKKAHELQVKNCVVAGASEYITDGSESFDIEMFNTVCAEIGSLMSLKKTSSKIH